MWSAYNGTPATSWFLLRKVPCASIFMPQHLGDGAAPVSKQGMVSHFAGARGNSILLCFIFPQPCLCHLLAVWPESNDFISVFFSVGNNTSPYLTQDLWRGNVLMYKHLGEASEKCQLLLILSPGEAMLSVSGPSNGFQAPKEATISRHVEEAQE